MYGGQDGAWPCMGCRADTRSHHHEEMGHLENNLAELSGEFLAKDDLSSM